MKAVKSISSCIQVKAGNPQADPCNTFEMIMDISEQHNLKSAFYFITDHSAGQIDGVYSIFHPLIRNLLKRIAERGHEIGLHASFNSYNDSVQTKKEFDLLKKVCTEEFIEQRCWGGRQHFLRWETPITWQNLEDAGLDYDTTLSFADRIGFRCGVCYEFSVFDVIAKEKLKLRERPLTVMEATVMREKYMNIDVKSEEAFQAITKIKGYCSLFKGDFRLLWHNSRLVEENDIRLYRQVLKY
jgi:peptidoglycan/xylan/chitin deacetylase (PgdA/CDA1 family)